MVAGAPWALHSKGGNLSGMTVLCPGRAQWAGSSSNELPRASGAVKDMLLSVLDNPGSFSISLPTGENLTAHGKFLASC